MLKEENLAAEETKGPRPLGTRGRERETSLGEGTGLDQLAAPHCRLGCVECRRKPVLAAACAGAGDEKHRDDGNELHSAADVFQVDQLPLFSTSAHAT